MWPRCVSLLNRLRGPVLGQHRLSRATSTLARREGGHGWRRRAWAVAGGTLLVVGARAAHASCLPADGAFMDIEEDVREASPMEMNEVAALTHTSLLRQASGVAVDGAIQLLHRTLRATLDFSHLHRKQLQEVIELLEYCAATLRHPEEHDRLWDLLVAARAKADTLKRQLRDLDLLMSYACAAVESVAMAAYISGGDFSASAARQITDSAKLELRTDERKREALEMQYTITHTLYIEAAQKMIDETGGTDDDGAGVDGDDAATAKDGDDEGEVERKKMEGEEERRKDKNIEEEDGDRDR